MCACLQIWRLNCARANVLLRLLHLGRGGIVNLSWYLDRALNSLALGCAKMSSGNANNNRIPDLGLMNSISADCTPSKHKYDQCFNAWFRDYLDVSSNMNGDDNSNRARTDMRTVSNSSQLSVSKKQANALASLRERYENDCGRIYDEYQACVKVRWTERPVYIKASGARKGPLWSYWKSKERKSIPCTSSAIVPSSWFVHCTWSM